MIDTNYQAAEKFFPQDKILAKTALKLFPKSITPNHITVFRFLASPIVGILMLCDSFVVGLVAFLLVAFSDALDGSMARTRNQITNWGKIYDPLADKILIACAIFTIVLRYVDLWTSLIIIILETIIVLVAWRRKERGGKVEANIWGKIKMCLQVLGVTILLISIVFDWAGLLPFASGTLYLAIAFAIVSLLSYGI
ncbi:MAG: CDP-alcohol phosphatidyltransferase family protein [Patescibacteria group bacterium]|nr:CDP-alcohol phosphatidyltransferase family protein [Patescibacteria group bacterium]MDD4610364.1 CDP-alcohol phosphatidyltransferase family protein [Patescibacteria group bacterium]